MCEHGTDVPVHVKIPADLSSTSEAKWREFGIDACIAPIVKALQEGGIDMRSSCCGHGERPGEIVLVDGRVLRIAPPVASDDFSQAEREERKAEGRCVECGAPNQPLSSPAALALPSGEPDTFALHDAEAMEKLAQQALNGEIDGMTRHRLAQTLTGCAQRLRALAASRSSLSETPEAPTRYDQVENGCWAAVLAGLTGIPHERLSRHVPASHFVNDTPEGQALWIAYHDAMLAELNAHGWTYARVGNVAPKGFAMGIGVSSRGINHTVIVHDGELWHDPHPSRGGVEKFASFEIVVPFAVSPQEDSRS